MVSSGLWLMPELPPRRNSIAWGIASCSFIASCPAPLGMRCTGHDAMKLHEVMPQAMLFLRGGNSGISHNPLETITSDDAQLCVQAFQHLLDQLATELA